MSSVAFHITNKLVTVYFFVVKGCKTELKKVRPPSRKAKNPHSSYREVNYGIDRLASDVRTSEADTRNQKAFEQQQIYDIELGERPKLKDLQTQSSMPAHRCTVSKANN